MKKATHLFLILKKPDLYNFKYSMTGLAKHIEPELVLDDGEFTYFKFPKINSELPAIFYINPDHEETLVNHRSVGEYVVVERVADQFILRSGEDHIMVWNLDMGNPNSAQHQGA